MNFMISMNIFDSLFVYASEWKVAGERDFTSEEISMVEKATVEDSMYGTSVCFFMKSGGRTYVPLSRDCDLPKGTEINLDTVKILTLQKSGESDIQRIVAEPLASQPVVEVNPPSTTTGSKFSF